MSPANAGLALAGHFNILLFAPYNEHMAIFMVRHGQSESNAHQIVTGDRDSPLSRLGRHQAELAGQEAAKLDLDLIFSSSLSRAHETAKIISSVAGYPEADVKTRRGLIERGLGDLEGVSYADNPRLNGNFPEAEDYKNIEKLEHLHGRVSHALKEILADSKGKNVLIVCHMNIGRMLWLITAGKPLSEFYNQPRLENAKIYKLLSTN